ncbi:MAG TPA: glycosyltransferase, partial [Elusimicrobiota bacterium]|nr:glycosyltransferase [Elusimicrobiota bacterium]
AVRAAYERDGRRAFVRAFHSDMATVYSAADVVVGRAGANTVMEIYRMGKAALLVPFPHATSDHQTANALALARGGAATVVAEGELTVDRLADLVNAWPALDDLRRANDARLAAVPADFSRAAERLADLVESAVGKELPA